MDRLFWGSPACFFLSAIVFELTYLTIYLTCRANMLAAAGGFMTCNLFICVSLLAYARSPYLNAEFPAWVALQCVGQAFIAGLLLAIPVTVGVFRMSEPWGYLPWVWAITLLVDFTYDFLLVGLFWIRLPVWRFTTRAQRVVS